MKRKEFLKSLGLFSLALPTMSLNELRINSRSVDNSPLQIYLHAYLNNTQSTKFQAPNPKINRNIGIWILEFGILKLIINNLRKC